MKDLKFLITKSLWDYEPFGQIKKGKDCFSGCKFFTPLSGELKKEYGVCLNVKSHRCGLLTSKGQGCYEFKK